MIIGKFTITPNLSFVRTFFRSELLAKGTFAEKNVHL